MILKYFLIAWALCVCAASLYVVHKLSMKLYFYRWLVHSVIYPYNWYITRQFIKKAPFWDKEGLLKEVERAKPWNYDTWFGRRLRKQLIKGIR